MDSAPTRAKFWGDALLEELNNYCWCGAGGLADEQMNMVGHEHVGDELEWEFCADLAEDLGGDVFAACRSEEISTLVAGEGDEVKIAAASDALEVVRHKRKEAHPLPKANPQRVGHPRWRKLPLEMNHTLVCSHRASRRTEKKRRMRHPPILGFFPGLPVQFYYRQPEVQPIKEL